MTFDDCLDLNQKLTDALTRCTAERLKLRGLLRWAVQELIERDLEACMLPEVQQACVELGLDLVSIQNPKGGGAK